MEPKSPAEPPISSYSPYSPPYSPTYSAFKVPSYSLPLHPLPLHPLHLSPLWPLAPWSTLVKEEETEALDLSRGSLEPAASPSPPPLNEVQVARAVWRCHEDVCHTLATGLDPSHLCDHTAPQCCILPPHRLTSSRS